MKKLAPLYRRVVAFLIDVLIVWGIVVAINFIVFLYAPTNISDLVGNVSIVLLIGHLFLKDGFNGQSIGKKVVGIQVVHFANGRPISHPYSAIRAIPMIMLLPVDVLFCIGQYRKRLGDIFAGTIVIRREK